MDVKILEDLLQMTIDRGNLRTWDMMQHREEPLLGGNAHSVRCGEIIHDGSGQPDSANKILW